jgi:hypothetical protein
MGFLSAVEAGVIANRSAAVMMDWYTIIAAPIAVVVLVILAYLIGPGPPRG